LKHLTDPASGIASSPGVLRPGGRDLPDSEHVGLRDSRGQAHSETGSTVRSSSAWKVVPEEDTFPTAYKTNTRRDVDALA
jgi:hypothetical protein